MASKRSHEASEGSGADAAAAQPAPKRTKKRDHQNAHIDPTWGQKYVFSSSDGATTVPFDAELDFEDDADAMAYLKSVRTQANGIPHLLVAPKVPIGPQLPKELQRTTDEADDAEEGEEAPEHDRDIYTSGQGDFRGYYHDGAYTARPADWGETKPEQETGDAEDGEWTEPDQEDPSSALREAYFASILARFATLRALLHTPPPSSAVSALPPTHDYHVGSFGPKSYTFSTWSDRLSSHDPAPAQVASMDKDAVLRVVRVLLGGKFLRRGGELRERTSRWLWALLARLPERGELNHVEIGWVRDLGRRAVLMMQSLADMAALRDALEGEGADLGVHDAVDDSSDDEDVLGEMVVEEGDGESVGSREVSDKDDSTEDDAARPNGADTEMEDGERDDDQKSEPMDVSEDGEVDEGEITDEKTAPAETLEEARARLLAQLDTAAVEVPTEGNTAADEEEDDTAQMRARMNMRATLNMILTVAGEFYGQRDLLEFRDPFTGM
ncbi:snare complex subunit vam7 [Colletotrichum plurivorum]|uniref:Snare complex subunit vam7 n=1 Tax=Colletotrichum plurivorum TaxID=2175906 RepID=A0A8H6KTL8_9PEZI|nr:snare complex subunit vam7 [Colletotrichum plurivorum]